MNDYDRDEAEIEASRAPLLDHLVELRKRLIVCVAAVIAGFALCFAFADPIYQFLLHPFKMAAQIYAASKEGHGGGAGPFDLLFVLTGIKEAPAASGDLRLMFTAPLEFFFTKLKLAGFGAVVLTFPILAWQVYAFVAPGLYKRERHAFLPFLFAAPLLFLLGAALVYFIILPFVLWFSLSQQIMGAGVAVELLPKVSDYLTLVTTLLLAFGLCFQLPVVLTLLGLAGIVNSAMLMKGWRYAVFGVVVVAAIVTPPDPISQLLLATPIVGLYFVSIGCVKLIELRRKKADEAPGTDIVAT
ncbi:twin-arginine translocase subunit TatC [Phenylobacterium sp. SCN 70-31]|uniref:twin-arginine translocase subunit TatC n=1 Tax=Phenylobacterium sp. SCN 70-31 TaxID=1660129 RepID=UPI00086B083C|nr:twin-arginine translocase subunit TatC [Phenylobacterium sp. SCN 70-31]ODT87082.1 MAG: twin arginine-targeting protein translocase TatC [Phenylobacterium sp. SCN 70-31]